LLGKKKVEIFGVAPDAGMLVQSKCPRNRIRNLVLIHYRQYFLEESSLFSGETRRN
jgi:hypothetical protein